MKTMTRQNNHQKAVNSLADKLCKSKKVINIKNKLELRSGIKNIVRFYALFTKLRVVLQFSLTLYILSVRVGLGVKCCLLKYPTTHGAKWGQIIYHVVMFVKSTQYKKLPPVHILKFEI